MTCLARLTAPLWRQTTPTDAALVVQYSPSSRLSTQALRSDRLRLDPMSLGRPYPAPPADFGSAFADVLTLPLPPRARCLRSATTKLLGVCCSGESNENPKPISISHYSIGAQ